METGSCKRCARLGLQCVYSGKTKRGQACVKRDISRLGPAVLALRRKPDEGVTAVKAEVADERRVSASSSSGAAAGSSNLSSDAETRSECSQVSSAHSFPTSDESALGPFEEITRAYRAVHDATNRLVAQSVVTPEQRGVLEQQLAQQRDALRVLAEWRTHPVSHEVEYDDMQDLLDTLVSGLSESDVSARPLGPEVSARHLRCLPTAVAVPVPTSETSGHVVTQQTGRATHGPYPQGALMMHAFPMQAPPLIPPMLPVALPMPWSAEQAPPPAGPASVPPSPPITPEANIQIGSMPLASDDSLTGQMPSTVSLTTTGAAMAVSCLLSYTPAPQVAYTFSLLVCVLTWAAHYHGTAHGVFVALWVAVVLAFVVCQVALDVTMPTPELTAFLRMYDELPSITVAVRLFAATTGALHYVMLSSQRWRLSLFAAASVTILACGAMISWQHYGNLTTLTMHYFFNLVCPFGAGLMVQESGVLGACVRTYGSRYLQYRRSVEPTDECRAVT